MAEHMLTEAGFINVEIEEQESSEPKGTVLKQYPDGGTKLDVNTTIKLTISKGLPASTGPEIPPVTEPDNTVELLIPLELKEVPEVDCVLTIWNGAELVEEREVFAGTVSVELKLRGEGLVTFTAKLDDEAATTWTFQVDFTDDELGL